MTTESRAVGGIAIRPGTSRNGIYYSAEELKAFAPTLNNKPILKDHISATDNTIGKVTSSVAASNGAVRYTGWIKEDGTNILEKIEDGRIETVSIGAIVRQLVEEVKDGKTRLVAVGLEGMELSTTPTPGVKGTSIKQTLQQITQRKQNEKIKVMPVFEEFTGDYIQEAIPTMKEIKEELAPETEDAVAPTEPAKEEVEAEAEAETEDTTDAEETTEESNSLKINVDSSEVDTAIKKTQELLGLKQKLQEKTMNETKDTMKGKISTVAQETSEPSLAEGYVVEQSEYGDGVSLWKQPSLGE